MRDHTITRNGTITAPKVMKGTVTIQPDTGLSRVLTKTSLLLGALRRWHKMGRPLADRTLRQTRLSACAACEYWKPAGNLGLGECTAPGCGCTKLKAWLLTEKCPHPQGSRWPKESDFLQGNNQPLAIT
jgi:hypothetical protein